MMLNKCAKKDEEEKKKKTSKNENNNDKRNNGLKDKNGKKNEVNKGKNTKKKYKANPKKFVDFLKKIKKTKVLNFFKKVRSVTRKVTKTRGKPILIALEVIPWALDMYNEYVVMSEAVKEEIQKVSDFFSTINKNLDTDIESIFRTSLQVVLYLIRNDENKETVDKIQRLSDAWYDTDIFQTILLNKFLEKLSSYFEDSDENKNSDFEDEEILDDKKNLNESNVEKSSLDPNFKGMLNTTSGFKETKFYDNHINELTYSLKTKLEEIVGNLSFKNNDIDENTIEKNETTGLINAKSNTFKIDQINNILNKILEQSTQLSPFKNLFSKELIEFLSSNINNLDFIEETDEEDIDNNTYDQENNQNSLKDHTSIENEYISTTHNIYKEKTTDIDEILEPTTQYTENKNTTIDGSDLQSNNRENVDTNGENSRKNSLADMPNNDIKTSLANNNYHNEKQKLNDNKLEAIDEYADIKRTNKTNLPRENDYNYNSITKNEDNNIELTLKPNSNNIKETNSLQGKRLVDSNLIRTTPNPDFTFSGELNTSKNKLENSFHRLLVFLAYTKIKEKKPYHEPNKLYLSIQNEIQNFKNSIYYNFYKGSNNIQQQINVNVKRFQLNQTIKKKPQEHQPDENDATLKTNKISSTETGKNKDESKIEFYSINNGLQINLQKNYYNTKDETINKKILNSGNENHIAKNDELNDRRKAISRLNESLTEDKYNLLGSINPYDFSYDNVIHDGYKLYDKIKEFKTILTKNEEDFILLIYSFFQFRLNDNIYYDEKINDVIILFDKFYSAITWSKCRLKYPGNDTKSIKNMYRCLEELNSKIGRMAEKIQMHNRN